MCHTFVETSSVHVVKPQRQATDEKKKKQQPHDLFSRVEQRGRATASHTNTLVTTVSPVLTNPMAPGGGLQVVLRVEVAVDKDDGVSGGEVQADSSCKRSQCFCVCVCAAACVTFTCCHALLVDLWCRLNHCTITHAHTQKKWQSVPGSSVLVCLCWQTMQKGTVGLILPQHLSLCNFSEPPFVFFHVRGGLPAKSVIAVPLQPQ